MLFVWWICLVLHFVVVYIFLVVVFFFVYIWKKANEAKEVNEVMI